MILSYKVCPCAPHTLPPPSSALLLVVAEFVRMAVSFTGAGAAPAVVTLAAALIVSVAMVVWLVASSGGWGRGLPVITAYWVADVLLWEVVVLLVVVQCVCAVAGAAVVPVRFLTVATAELDATVGVVVVSLFLLVVAVTAFGGFERLPLGVLGCFLCL